MFLLQKCWLQDTKTACDSVLFVLHVLLTHATAVYLFHYVYAYIYIESIRLKIV